VDFRFVVDLLYTANCVSLQLVVQKKSTVEFELNAGDQTHQFSLVVPRPITSTVIFHQSSVNTRVCECSIQHGCLTTVQSVKYVDAVCADGPIITIIIIYI
jgi:hypothetical protein